LTSAAAAAAAARAAPKTSPQQPANLRPFPKDSGCNLRRPSNEAGVGAGMLAIGFVALGLSRRRRR
jgi:hypothetical protein